MRCNLCPRKCNTVRGSRDNKSIGYCGQGSEIRLARAALHFWEEPCISAKEGSGAVFFSGCNLKCIYCQNRDIAIGNSGKIVSVERLAEIFLELQEKKANNINLVTGNHFIPEIAKAIIKAKDNGLIIPLVYNTSSYENVDSLKILEGLIDVYLPDMKYMDAELAKKYSNAVDYPEVAKMAIDEMVRQQPICIFDDEKNECGETNENSEDIGNGVGKIKKGVIVRHLILPGHTLNSMDVIKYLLARYGDNIYISIMNQYTPLRNDFEYTELNRKVTKREYEKVINFALDMGLTNGFFQEGGTASESFIPAFNNEGV